MNISVVVPTINSLNSLKECLKSLSNQSYKCKIIVVANGTNDGTQDYIKLEHPEVLLIESDKPLGFAGAVNTGIKQAIKDESEYVALLNNDAIADKDWLMHLATTMDKDEKIGIATSKIKKMRSNTLDTTGDCYTSWLLPYPRGRDEIDKGQYDKGIEYVTSASGGASLYRTKMLKEVGLFDKDFFAYYEDVDISLRVQHKGWRIAYNPLAVVSHEIGGTSKNIKGFTTLQTMKNLPLLYVKNVPAGLLIKYVHGFNLAYLMFLVRAFTRGHGYYALKGLVLAILLLPKKILDRSRILKNSKLSTTEFDQLLVHDLPPNAKILRKIRTVIRGKK